MKYMRHTVQQWTVHYSTVHIQLYYLFVVAVFIPQQEQELCNTVVANNTGFSFLMASNYLQYTGLCILT